MYASRELSPNRPAFRIDLRSDTVTKPTAGMISAMAMATVGDDVLGDDPTVSELELRVANAAGKAAAAFFPSGTQSNLAGIMAHCERGDEYIVGNQAHTYRFEGGGAAVLGSVQPQPIDNREDGTLPVEKIIASIKPDDFHFAKTKLITLENTIGGRPLELDYILEVEKIARSRDLVFHLDGARAWNAMVANDQTLSDLCRPFDSASLCFSKGLGAPMGSVLVGTEAFIERARRVRKMLGGGLRQSGYLAAACLYALEHNISRLADDHRLASELAEGLRGALSTRVEYSGTNMLFVHGSERLQMRDLAEFLRHSGIGVVSGPTLRLVCHLGISSDDVGAVVEAARAFSRTAP